LEERFMSRTFTGVLALLLVMPALAAQDDTKKKPREDQPQPPEEQYKALQKEYQTAQQEYSKAMRAAQTNEERQKVFADKYPKPQAFAARFLELAQKNPKSPVAVDALIWVSTNAGYTVEGAKAVDLLFQEHITSDKLGPACQSLVYSQSKSAEKNLRAALEKNPHKEVQGRACFSLAQYLKNHSERGSGAGSKKQSEEAERLFEQVVEKYADLKHYRGTLGEAAKGVLFEIRNLSIGKPVPEIEGEDIDGKKFKISDYRGKVVMLDFWGHW
jgi:hypothetical protein